MIETISDTEFAEKIGFPLRGLRKLMDEHGLCLKRNRRRRLTPSHQAQLINILEAKPWPSKSINAKPESTTFGARTTASALTKALKLAAEMKRKESAKNASEKSTKTSF